MKKINWAITGQIDCKGYTQKNAPQSIKIAVASDVRNSYLSEFPGIKMVV